MVRILWNIERLHKGLKIPHGNALVEESNSQRVEAYTGSEHTAGWPTRKGNGLSQAWRAFRAFVSTVRDVRHQLLLTIKMREIIYRSSSSWDN